MAETRPGGLKATEVNALGDLNALALHELSDVLCDTGLVERLLDLALDEDLGGAGRTDITSVVSIPAEHRSRFHVVARKAGVAAGLIPLYELTNRWPEIAYAPTVRDGDAVAAGQTVARIAGPTREILGIERVYLNLLGRLSGIATRTRQFVEAMGTGHRAHLYDTRKTTPGLRVLEKYAVRCGGGRCHRFGLHDAVLLKDNHIAHVPLGELGAFVAEASRKARAIWASGPTPLLRPFVEVEVDTLEQFAEILSVEPGLVDIVLLDNMGTEKLERAVAMRDGAGSRIELEASGGVTLETIRAIALTGVERISVGSITHGATVLDFGLDAL
ncbi:MAG: carboxylating nicotinate-nucleotide diphosphorylase [Phycisphaeraceae bacterium]|nr:MAG: carboxylating nicotinate-nucleotide diphosphorylase [Phycisphaeraceae bacterium]